MRPLLALLSLGMGLLAALMIGLLGFPRAFGAVLIAVCFILLVGLLLHRGGGE